MSGVDPRLSLGTVKSTPTEIRAALLQELTYLEVRIAEIHRELGALAVAAPRRPTFSPADKRMMAAAQKVRWAKRKAGIPIPAAAAKKARRKLSMAGRALIMAAAKARWAKVKENAKAARAAK